jgi:hypothetical protein
MNREQEQLDRDTRQRLGKLASMPVDLSRLERRMADALGPPESQQPKTRHNPARHRSAEWLRVAAAVLLFAGIGAGAYFAFFQVDPSSAVAQTMTVAELHQHLVDDPQATYRANSVEQAQKILDDQLLGHLALPIVDGTQVESCCLVEGQFPLRAALVVDHPNGHITIVVAQGRGFAHPMAPIEHRSGVPLSGHEHAGMPMVMRNSGDLWMCVMGDVEVQALSDVAAGMTFRELGP